MGGGGTVYQGVYMNANITNLSNQTMAIYVPAEYFTTDAEGNVTGINHEGAAGGYTADTAPIVYLNECGGWKSSSPRSCDTSYIEQGMIYVTAGARSRDAVSEDGTTRTGKAPTQMADLKSGIIELRANGDVIPGDKDKIVSVGYNILLAAQALGKDIDYHLVWDMGHGSNEGTSTGTFIEWINEICAGE